MLNRDGSAWCKLRSEAMAEVAPPSAAALLKKAAADYVPLTERCEKFDAELFIPKTPRSTWMASWLPRFSVV
jgi:hypothetical protein